MKAATNPTPRWTRQIQDPINRGHTALYMYRPPPAGALYTAHIRARGQPDRCFRGATMLPAIRCLILNLFSKLNVGV